MGSPPDELLRPLYEQTQDIWHAPGIPLRSLERVVEALLDLGWTPPTVGSQGAECPPCDACGRADA